MIGLRFFFFPKSKTDKGLTSKIYEELCKSNKKRTSTPIEKWANDMTGNLQKKKPPKLISA